MAYVDGELYVKVWVVIMGVYALQMLLVPAKMTTDHWNLKSNKHMEFWIRGASVGFGGMAYLMTLIDTEKAVQVGTAASFAIGVLYPWNAKYGYLTPGLKLKYPMHYVPEFLMLGLTLGGVAAMEL